MPIQSDELEMFSNIHHVHHTGVIFDQQIPLNYSKHSFFFGYEIYIFLNAN